MASEASKAPEKETPQQPTTWLGHWDRVKQRWFCDCNRQARCLTVKKSGPNYNKKFWTCTKGRDDNDQCPFFLWDEEQAQAKEWMEIHNPQPPETPTRKGKGTGDETTKRPETPWTKAKRKPVSREVSDGSGDENEEPSKEKDGSGGDGDEEGESREGMNSPSRKAAKTTKSSTPGQSFIETMNNAGGALPTPDTNNKGKAIVDLTVFTDSEAGPSNAIATSPTPARFNNPIIPRDEKKSDLASTVIKLLRSENVELKESTEMQLRDEIEVGVAVMEMKLKKYQETLKMIYRRLDELENTVLLLTGEGGSGTEEEFKMV